MPKNSAYAQCCLLSCLSAFADTDIPLQVLRQPRHITSKQKLISIYIIMFTIQMIPGKMDSKLLYHFKCKSIVLWNFRYLWVFNININLRFYFDLTTHYNIMVIFAQTRTSVQAIWFTLKSMWIHV
jgi:hypothetical protein